MAKGKGKKKAAGLLRKPERKKAKKLVLKRGGGRAKPRAGGRRKLSIERAAEEELRSMIEREKAHGVALRETRLRVRAAERRLREKEKLAERAVYEQREMERGGELLSTKYKLPAGLGKELEGMPWETVANLANSFKLKAEGENAGLRKLQKEIELTRLILLERIAHHRKAGAFDYKFLVDLVRLLERCEKLAVKHEIDLDEFKTFVYVLIEKLKKERLVIYSAIESRFRRADESREAFTSLKENLGSGLP